jgi:hypothetical protein
MDLFKALYVYSTCIRYDLRAPQLASLQVINPLTLNNLRMPRNCRNGFHQAEA